MKLFKAQFDSASISMYAETVDDAMSLLKERDHSFIIDEGAFKYKWPDGTFDDVYIYELPIKQGIINWEFH